MDYFANAYKLLNEWKGSSYVFGSGCLSQIGQLVRHYAENVLVVANKVTSGAIADEVLSSLSSSGVRTVCNVCPGARPNAPKEDVYRIATYILQYKPEAVVAIGGGSLIDACKASAAIASLGRKVTPEIDYYFGAGKVSAALHSTGLALVPVVAVETSSSSGSHLTKYSNITDPMSGQKKLIVDPAIVPEVALFDYDVTCSMPAKVAIDGALDSIAHVFEVFCGANESNYEKASVICETAISLVLDWAGRIPGNPMDLKAREALGLASDLGGYAIMIGGTSGAHLTSFSLVDIVGHGTACGIMNPYYAVFYSEAIEPQLRAVGRIFASRGYGSVNIESLKGRELGEAVAEAMIEFSESINAPTKLTDIPGYSHEVHFNRAINAAKDPDLRMKLQNMPVPMDISDVDEYMAPVLLAAENGDFKRIRTK